MDYFVATGGDNTAQGTLESPFATIAYAAGVASDGDAVYLRRGDYAERVVINRPLTLAAYKESERAPHEIVTLRPNASQKTEVVLIQYPTSVTLDGLIVDAVNTRRGISVNNATAIRLLNFEVMNCIGRAEGERGQGVIISGASSDVLLENFYIHHVSAQGRDADYAHGVYASCNGLVIRHGKITDISCNGVHFFGAGEGTCLVECCRIRRCAIGVGFYTGRCRSLNNDVQDCTVAYMARYDIGRAEFYHNTGYACLLGLDAKNFDNADADIKAVNNVFFVSTPTPNSMAIAANTTRGKVDAHHNVRSGMARADEAIGTDVSVSSITATFSPYYADDKGVRPMRGNPVLGAGVPISGITTDKAGRTRPIQPTIGAYEAQSRLAL